MTLKLWSFTIVPQIAKKKPNGHLTFSAAALTNVMELAH
jgi:hypothetical protein